MAKINEITMSEIVDRAVELGFPTKRAKAKHTSTGISPEKCVLMNLF